MKNCRFCNSILKKTVIDLGKSPLANSYLKKSDFAQEKIYPLCVYLCEDCFLMQLEEIQNPEKIFSDYAYFSSYSTSWLQHAKDYTDMISKKLALNNDSLVIEIASNDGYLLQNFIQKNIPVLGIEPAKNVAKKAIENNIETIVKFFDSNLARLLVKDEKSADLIIGNNVLAHVPTLNDFILGMKILLKPKGVITLEFPHLFQLIKNNQFDTIYHEHFSYFSLLTAQKIFEFHELKIFDVDELSTHGGSLRIFITHIKNNSVDISKKVNQVLEKEKQFGLNKMYAYNEFKNNVVLIKKKLREFLINAKNNSKKVVCYGAPAKGNTLLNYCEIDRNLIEYVVDKNIHKQGLYLPGTHIPIFDPSKIFQSKPDYLLILPWNLKDEIMLQAENIREWEGKFVIPIPEVEILS